MFYANRAELGELALKSRLPMMCGPQETMHVGCLISYIASSRRSISARRSFRGQDSERSEARRHARGATYQDPPDNQPQDREGARAHYSAVSRGASRRDHPVMDRRAFR